MDESKVKVKTGRLIFNGFLLDGYFYFYLVYLLSIIMKSTFPIISITVFPLNVSNTRPLTYGNVSNFLVNSTGFRKFNLIA